MSVAFVHTNHGYCTLLAPAAYGLAGEWHLLGACRHRRSFVRRHSSHDFSHTHLDQYSQQNSVIFRPYIILAYFLFAYLYIRMVACF